MKLGIILPYFYLTSTLLQPYLYLTYTLLIPYLYLTYTKNNIGKKNTIKYKKILFLNGKFWSFKASKFEASKKKNKEKRKRGKEKRKRSGFFFAEFKSFHNVFFSIK